MYMDTGRNGPHPDLRVKMAGDLSDQIPEKNFTPSEVEVLQQRTVADLERSGGISGRETMTVLFGVIPAQEPDEPDHLVQYIARRSDDDSEWEWAGIIYKPYGDLGSTPWIGTVSMDPREGLAVGALAFHPDVAIQEIELPDGSIYQDAVENNSVLIYAPLRSQQNCTGEALLRMYSRDGRLIETQAIPLNPQPSKPPPNFVE